MLQPAQLEQEDILTGHIVVALGLFGAHNKLSQAAQKLSVGKAWPLLTDFVTIQSMADEGKIATYEQATTVLQLSRKDDTKGILVLLQALYISSPSDKATVVTAGSRAAAPVCQSRLLLAFAMALHSCPHIAGVHL